MTVATKEAPKAKDFATLNDLRAFAEVEENRVETLKASLAEARMKRESLTAERDGLVMKARVEKDLGAQTRLNEIDGQLLTLNRDIGDDENVLKQLAEQLSSAQENLYRAEWEQGRSVVRKMIETRLTGKSVKAIEKAVEALNEALRAASNEDDAINAAMLEFEPGLAREMKPLQLAGSERSRLAAWKLRDVLPVDTREFPRGYRGEWPLDGKTFAGSDQWQYEQLLKSLDRLELVF